MTKRSNPKRSTPSEPPAGGEGIRVDMRPEARPDIIADGRHLPLADGTMAAVLIDPPYNAYHARELYSLFGAI